jgi:hypothetical protein
LAVKHVFPANLGNLLKQGFLAKEALPGYALEHGTRPSPKGASVTAAKASLSVQVGEECLEESRDAVLFLRTKGIHVTLTQFVEAALERQIERLRDEHNDGKRFPRREQDLVPGRPFGL